MVTSPNPGPIIQNVPPPAPAPPGPPPGIQPTLTLSKSALIARGGQSAAFASGMVVGTLYQVDAFTGPVFGLPQGLYTVSP